MSRPLRLIDRYLLVQMAPPMAGAFAVVLISLLLYRILEIFNLLAASGAQFELATRLIGGLLPHYLGLALPAGYFISVFIVLVRMSESSEIDALLAGGLSLDRLTVPFVAVGVLVSAASLVLLGYLQPYGRYEYNEGLNEALASGWNGRLQPRTFLEGDGRLVVTADAVDPTGRSLRGVFVRRIDREGREQVFTARTGQIRLSDDGSRVFLTLRGGGALQERGAGPTSGTFDVFTLEAPAAASAGTPFRARGAGPRELTLPELLVRMREGRDAEARRRASSEFHTRVVRSVSPLLLPLLAMPLAIAAKRARRGSGFVVAAAVLLLYEYAIDGAQASADLGGPGPALAVWTPFTIFAGLCVGLYASSRRRPGQTALNALVEAIGRCAEAAAAMARQSFAKPLANVSR